MVCVSFVSLGVVVAVSVTCITCDGSAAARHRIFNSGKEKSSNVDIAWNCKTVKNRNNKKSGKRINRIFYYQAHDGSLGRLLMIGGRVLLLQQKVKLLSPSIIEEILVEWWMRPLSSSWEILKANSGLCWRGNGGLLSSGSGRLNWWHHC